MQKGFLISFVILMMVGCATMDDAIVNTTSMQNVMRSLTVKAVKPDVDPDEIKIIPGESTFAGTKWIAEFPNGTKYKCNKMGQSQDAYCVKVAATATSKKKKQQIK